MTRQQQLDFFKDRNNISLEFAFCLDSGVQGKHSIISGGVHGTEPAGVEAIIEFTNLVESGQIQINSGKITFILGNPQAYLENKRFIDYNMNRVFTPELMDNYEGQRAVQIRQYFESIGSFDYCLDIHSVSVGNLKIAISTKDQSEFLKEISTVSTHFTYQPNHSLNGAFIEETVKFGAKAVCIECGNHNNPKAYQTGLFHIIKILQLDQSIQINSEVKLPKILDPDQIVTFRYFEKIVPNNCFKWVNPQVSTGTFIAKGEIYATLENGENRIAPKDCYIFIPDRNPGPTDTDAGFLCDVELFYPEFYTNSTSNWTEILFNK
jgi:succinylglutamate desuccinylase